MFTFRCTKVLLNKLKLPVTSDPPSPTTRLGDWYGNVLNMGHQRLMIFISDRSLLPIIMPLRERHDLLENFKIRLAMVLLYLDIDADIVSDELDQMEPLIVAPTASRSVLGSLNDFIHISKQYILEEDIELYYLAQRLSGIPCGPINYNSPGQRTRELLSPKNAQ